MKKRKMNYYLQNTKLIPEDTIFKRIGIIPYFINKDDDVSMFLMLDSKYKELTDCGGFPKINESWIDAAIRETEEESRNFFTFKKECIIDRGRIFWREDHSIAIIFMDVSNIIQDSEKAMILCDNYRLSYGKGIENKDMKERLENSDMFFYNISEISNLAKKKKQIYYPVKMLLLKFIRNKLSNSLSEKIE